MAPLDVILKSIYLLHRENISENKTATDSSCELVKNTMTLLNKPKDSKLIGGDTEIITNLKMLCKNMCDNPDSFDSDTLTQSLDTILKEKEGLLKTTKDTINKELTPAGLKKSIVSMRNYLTSFHNETKLKSLISKANYELTVGSYESSINAFGVELMNNIDALISVVKGKDPGVMDEIDMTDDTSVSSVMDRVKDEKNATSKLQLGWHEMNDMTQGGFRRGECILLNALQHQYKSGTTQSLTAQVAQNNTPFMLEDDKKPLITYISFEDDATVFGNFLYKYLYHNNTGELPDLETVTSEEIGKYIKEELSKKGYYVKMLRVNPSEWTFRDLFNYILRLEASGFELHAVFVDYLAKLPTTGCTIGAGGTDFRDLLNRCRNFFGSKLITFLTPHQISTEGKQLIRNGVSDSNFVKEIAGKGYTEISKQIDQVVDLEIYQHKAKIKGRWHLTFMRGKHRGADILDEDKFYFTLPFPDKAPIPENINSERTKSGSVGSDEDQIFDAI